MHLPQLIHDLAVILTTAAITTLIFGWLRQPQVLGYLAAGFLLSPHVNFFPSVGEIEGVRIWAEIGVIFLMFGLGLEFSFRKLVRVGPSASITALFEVLFMLAVGYLVGRTLNWSTMDSLFLGGILSISSTTIILRALQELNLKGRGFVSLVFAVLVVEDLVAILLLVLLSTIAVSRTFAGTELVYSSLRLLFFLVLWFVAGISLLPTLFRKLRKLLGNEVVLIVSVGLCLAMVVLATALGFSPALGAFVMGSLLAETNEGKRIEHLLEPVRDLFAAVFFVSVGMLIEPESLVKYGGIILLLCVVTIVGKVISTSVGALISGQSLRHSTQAGFSLAQIGEFSFIIATLGQSLKVTSDFLYPIAVAVSAVTTLTTPYLVRSADPFYNWFEARIPDRTKRWLQQYQQSIRGPRESGVLVRAWERIGYGLLFNSVVIVAIQEGFRFLRPLWTPPPGVEFIAVLIFSSPFLWAIWGGRFTRKASGGVATTPGDRAVMMALRFLIGFGLLVWIVGRSTEFRGWTLTVIFGLPLILILGQKSALRVYERIETLFRFNLDSEGAPSTPKANPALAPWDAVLAEVELPARSPLCGLTLLEAKLRENFGVIVAAIDRGGLRITAPQRDQRLMPHDRLTLIGTDAQLSEAQATLGEEVPATENSSDFRLEPVLLGAASPFVGQTIRECGVREMTDGLVVGVEREGQRWLNPDSNLQLKEGDLLWIVGDRRRIVDLKI